MDSLDGYVSDDELAIEPLADLGWEVETVSWRQTARPWSDFDTVIIRTPWDYQNSPSKFLDVLREIESQTRLENPLDIVRWNLDKRYLRKMVERGTRIVPTIWDGTYTEAEFDGWVEKLNTHELIIKPYVSATAEHTYRLQSYDPSLENVFATRPFMVQPFMPFIVSEGEYSLFYFNGEFSHAINKAPKAADFRVQEEHGGLITSVKAETKLLWAAGEALEMIGKTLLYARVDLVRDDADRFALMELELIEPALYLRMDGDAPRRFASAIDELMN